MKRIDTTIDNVKREIARYYRPELHHFMVMNAVEMGEKTEVQWFFGEYGRPEEVIAYCVQVEAGTEIPSIADIVPSAWVAEAELVDLLDIHIENTEKGFVLDADSENAPLKKKK